MKDLANQITRALFESPISPHVVLAELYISNNHRCFKNYFHILFLVSPADYKCFRRHSIRNKIYFDFADVLDSRTCYSFSCERGSRTREKKRCRKNLLGMPLERLIRHHVLLMNVFALPSPRPGAGCLRQCCYSTFVASIANPRYLRRHCRPRKRLVPLLLMVLRRLVKIDCGLPHLCRVSDRIVS